MKGVFATLVSAFAAVALAEQLPPSHILYGEGNVPESLLKERSPALSSSSSCVNGPTTRSCWGSGYSVATDFDKSWPTTGTTRYYNLVISNTTCAPDGSNKRTCLLINGVYPGPVITANWGDYIQVTVTNNMQSNGTGIHWHGIRQLNTNTQDGVGGITECPIAPGHSTTYKFQATQFGTTWYHSHFSAQYGDGVVGTLVINGPASANYDYDLGPVPVNDWYYKSAYQIDSITTLDLQHASPGPPGDNILINGKNKAPGNATGSYMKYTVTKGKKYRLRFVNISVDNSIRVSVDHHPLTVITSDFVPILPITTDSVLLAIGQRYDVILNANETVGNYWMRATVENACFNGNNGVGLAIVSYIGASSSNPTTGTTAIDNGCSEPGTLTPWVQNTVGSVSAFQSQANSLAVNIDLPGVDTNNQNVVTWGINVSAIDVQWSNPTLTYVQTGNTDYPSVINLIELPNQGVWVYWVIQEVQGGPVSIPHPMHLHGHDFYVLGKGSGQFNMQTDPANLHYSNPTRRDTSMLPAGGWMVIAFPTDNPGAWLFHCHIAWHISEGLGVQFLETPSQIKLPSSSYNTQCKTFSTYANTSYYAKDDSGL